MTEDCTAQMPLPHARIVARTDGAGSTRSVDVAAGAAPPPALAVTIDVVAAALARAGEALAAGKLRSALVVFEGAIVAIGRTEGRESVAVIGDPQAMPGLVLGHLHRVLAEAGAKGMEP